MFYSFLQNGAKITISDKKGVYAPAVFYMENGNLYVYNKYMGRCDTPFTSTQKNLNEHIAKMVEEGFTITITTED